MSVNAEFFGQYEYVIDVIENIEWIRLGYTFNTDVDKIKALAEARKVLLFQTDDKPELGAYLYMRADESAFSSKIDYLSVLAEIFYFAHGYIPLSQTSLLCWEIINDKNLPNGTVSEVLIGALKLSFKRFLPYLTDIENKFNIKFPQKK